MKNLSDSNRPVCKLKNVLFMALVMVFCLISSKSIAQKAKWVTPKLAESIKNPLAGNNTTLADSKTLYVNNCAPCHGLKGKGDGPAAQALTPKPADHSSSVIQSETDGSLFWKLSEGRNPMPGYKKMFTEQQRWGLINYIRTLAKKS
jgi:mono/diheme cytochrome c family protein